MNTVKIAEPISGDKLYQRRARLALPVLVRQAEASAPIYYSDLAAELSIPNPRTLNHVLGSIGRSLQRLSKQWREPVPPLQCLVVNKKTGLPGEGVGWFITDKEGFRLLPRKQQRLLVHAELLKVFAFRRWPEVLATLGLERTTPTYQDAVISASTFKPSGESERHRCLKEFVARNPRILGLPVTLSGALEFALPSGDCVDVLFKHGDEWVAAEVKSRLSPVADVVRGMFQCVKYRAVIEAYQASLDRRQDVRAILVLEDQLPVVLMPLKNLLEVAVVDQVTPQ